MSNTTTNHLANLLQEINSKSDKIIEIFLVSYWVFGMVLATFYGTYFMALVVGTLSIACYYLAKLMFKGKNVHHYVASAGVAIFMGQFIYQMHGMFEMHFFAFIGSTLMITYQNWKIQIPLALLIVVHHGVFGWLQYSSFIAGTDNMVFFTQLDYMNLQTFIIHCFLAVVIIFICGLWAWELRNRTIRNYENIVAMEEMSDKIQQNVAAAFMLASGNTDVEISSDPEDVMASALTEIKNSMTKQS